MPPTNENTNDSPITLIPIKHKRNDYCTQNKKIGGERISLFDTSKWSKGRLRGSIDQETNLTQHN